MVDHADPANDGQRYVIACCGEHLQVLIDEARSAWVDEELWFGQLCRASTAPRLSASALAAIGAHARLEPERVARALYWNAQSGSPRTRLPGGQILPICPP